MGLRCCLSARGRSGCPWRWSAGARSLSGRRRQRLRGATPAFRVIQQRSRARVRPRRTAARRRGCRRAGAGVAQARVVPARAGGRCAARLLRRWRHAPRRGRGRLVRVVGGRVRRRAPSRGGGGRGARLAELWQRAGGRDGAAGLLHARLHAAPARLLLLRRCH